MKYRKKPVVIDAVQWLPEAFDDGPKHTSDVVQWIADNGGKAQYQPDHPWSEWGTECPCNGYNATKLSTPHGPCIAISTLEGTMRASEGDWVIHGIKGEFYPCKPDIFAATYEPVEQQETQQMTEMPTLEDFLQHVGRMMAAHPDWRYGQTLFNVAQGCVPREVLEPLWGSLVDPFFDDGKAEAFLSALFPVEGGDSHDQQ